MPPTYYVIELSARWLTALLVALALVMVLAFAFGYGAAWSVLSSRGGDADQPALAGVSEASPTPEVVEEVILSEPEPTSRPTQPPESTPVPTPTPPPSPTPASPPANEFWVQVLASSTPQTVERAQQQLRGLGFPSDSQNLTTTQVAGGDALYKLRVGPFPDRESADRVVRRMRASGFPDAWVVVP